MIETTWIPLAESILAALLRTSAQGAVLGLLVWLLVRAVPQLPAAAKTALWWLVAARLLLGLALPVVELPILPGARPSTEQPPPAAWAQAEAAPPAPHAALAAVPAAPRAGKAPTRWSLGAALVATWLALLLVQVPGMARHWLAIRRSVRAARPVTSGPLAALYGRTVRAAGLEQPPVLALSPAVEAPQTVGILRPVILLPEASPLTFGAEELAATLCHELIHVRRRDLWFGWIPALARRVYFFHPLAVLAAREYGLAREAACDVAVLRVLGTAPQAYGRLLLRWGVGPRETGLAAAAASPTFATLKRRLEMLHQRTDAPRRPATLGWLLGAAALVAFIPVSLVARPPAPPAPPSPAEAPPAPPAPPTAATPELAPTPGVLTAPVPAPARAPRAYASPTPVVALTPPPPPPAAIPAPPPLPAPYLARGEGSSTSIWNDDGGGDPWVLLSGNHRMAHGSERDLRVAERARRGREDLLWFRQGGRAYVIRDPELLAEARALWQPVEELGRRQGELGARQGALGAQQGELGARQGELGARQGRLGAHEGAVAAAQAAVDAARAARDQAGDEGIERKLEALASELEDLAREMADLRAGAADLGAEFDSLGHQQEELSRQQEELARQQERLAQEQDRAWRKAATRLESLLDRAVQDGQAQPAD